MFKIKKIISVITYIGIILITSKITSFFLYNNIMPSQEKQIFTTYIERFIINAKAYDEKNSENMLMNQVGEITTSIKEIHDNDTLQLINTFTQIENENVSMNNYNAITNSSYIETKEISYDDIVRDLNLTEWVTENVYFRAEPSKAAEAKMILVPGDTVTVMNYKGNWAFCSIDGKLGWILDEFLSEEKYIPHKVSLGFFKITHYCSCNICCGPNAKGITSTGAVATAGVTIAVDPSKIPYGTKVEINGHEYIAQDCGGGVKQNHIDIFCSSHQEALNKGTYTIEVFQIND